MKTEDLLTVGRNEGLPYLILRLDVQPRPQVSPLMSQTLKRMRVGVGSAAAEGRSVLNVYLKPHELQELFDCAAPMSSGLELANGGSLIDLNEEKS